MFRTVRDKFRVEVVLETPVNITDPVRETLDLRNNSEMLQNFGLIAIQISCCCP